MPNPPFLDDLHFSLLIGYAKFKYFVSILSLMTEEKLELPEEESKEESKSETEKYIEDLIISIENELPKHVTYVTGIIVDDERNVLIIKNGKIYVGKDENNSREIKEYMKEGNAGYIINALYILQKMLNNYKDLWSGKIEREVRKALNNII